MTQPMLVLFARWRSETWFLFQIGNLDLHMEHAQKLDTGSKGKEKAKKHKDKTDSKFHIP